MWDRRQAGLGGAGSAPSGIEGQGEVAGDLGEAGQVVREVQRALGGFPGGPEAQRGVEVPDLVVLGGGAVARPDLGDAGGPRVRKKRGDRALLDTAGEDPAA